MSLLDTEIAFREPDWVTPSHLLGIRLRKDAPLDLLIDGVSQSEWKRTQLRSGEDSVDVTGTQGSLEMQSLWQRLGPGLVSRRDTLISHASHPIELRRCQSLIHLQGEDWTMEWQSSAWCLENQPEEGPLRGATLKLQHRPGRTSEQTTPYAVFSNPLGTRLSVHVVPEGNWTLRANPVATGLEPSHIALAAGHEDEGFRWTLLPGESLSLPEILYGKDEPHVLHEAWVERNICHGIPVVYNTWFRSFNNLDPEDLRKQLAAAAEIGCETFVVDAGWFGEGEGWWEQVGNWQEQTDRAFRGHMRAFADEVRSKGMTFGLWMEAERFSRQAPIRKEHPGWFPDNDQPFTRIDLTQPAAYEWLKGEIHRLVETYGLTWMKVDFNFELGEDRSGHALADYFRAWSRLILEVRKLHPTVVFEACSSGAMRLDLKVLDLFPVAFLSDTVNPWECLSIAHGAWKRLPPASLGRWAVLRHRDGETQTCSGAGWELAQTCSVEFAAATAFCGALGFSGDLASLPASERESLKKVVDAYTMVRPHLAQAVGFLLTPQKRIGDRDGWTAVQLHQSGWNLLGVYRLLHAGPEITLRPHQLAPERTYRIRNLLGGHAEKKTGAQILSEGITVRLEVANSAALIEIAEA